MFAVVGMDCLLPGSADAEAWIRAERPAIGIVPPDRWAGGGPPGAMAIVDAPVAEDVDAGLDLLFAWVLRVVRRALPPTADRQRTTLALASLMLPSTGFVRATAGPLVERLGVEVPWLRGGCSLDRRQGVGPAEVAARALGLGGPADALDAACASGLYAVRTACLRLAAREADCAVAAAVCRSDPSYLLHGFRALRALSQSGVPRPFDRRADGLVVGEGAVAVAIKRLADALRDGDPVHAVIRGGALGADGRKGNLLAPAEDGQLRTLVAAWAEAGVDPSTAGLVECHATGTAVGDAAELRSLERLLAGCPRRVALASAKGLVGHTVTAAGLAGLVRAIGAVRDGRLPAAVGCEEPRPELAASRTLRVAAAEPWPEGVPRRAGVSAFGFGGTNAHLVIEAHDGGPEHPVLPGPPDALAVVAVAARVGPASDADLLDALSSRRSLLSPAPPAVTRGLGDPAEGAWIAEVAVDPRRWRIPPVELLELLPQQLLALELASDAADRAPRLDPARTASVVGIEVEAHVADAVVRHALLGAGHVALADAVHPALTAARVQGSLPNFVANRVAAHLDLQGPSYVAAGATAALRHARALLAAPDLDAVLVGAVDLAGHPGAWRGPGPCGEAGVVLVVRRLADAERARDLVIAAVRLADGPTDEAHRATTGDCGAADALVALVALVARGTPGLAGGFAVEPRVRPSFPPDPWDRVAVVPHSGPPLPPPAPFAGAWGGPTVPIPRPLAEPLPSPLRFAGPEGAPVALSWPLTPSPSAAPSPSPRPAPLPDLAAALARSTAALAEAHRRFLDHQEQATDVLAGVADRLAALADPRAPISEQFIGYRSGATVPDVGEPREPSGDRTRVSDRSGRSRPKDDSDPEWRKHAPFGRPRGRREVEFHAAGKLSEAFGPSYADLDRYEPRVRMPLPPLLLVDRVVSIEGERGRFGPARVVTEYDVPANPRWTADGRPPAFVVVESGQADLLLVSWLGIDARCRGERVYRLLDCDLEFQGPRPLPGTTLRHDIRIDRFAELGATTLFYFRYDCADADGRPVLRMRNGCAGFFTRAELAHPRGVDTSPPALPTATPLRPIVAGAPAALDARAVDALAAGRSSVAFGPAFAPADGSGLRLPPDRDWRLVHRVPRLALSGGPHGLGEVVVEQDLRDDDWFNACHFQGDPCMPGTLMLEGCLQAVQLWLLAHGVGAEWRDARFEPLPGRPMRLRCRGQVAPGHRKLTYHARIREAGLGDRAWAVADVVLEVDGVPVVVAHEVGVEVVGVRTPLASTGPVVPRERVLEYSVGSAEAAFGPAYAPFEAPRRCARMPGPPLLQMTEVLAVEGPPLEIAADRAVTIAYEVPADAWWRRADPGAPMPFVLLLETALQPCGWLTAWQGAPIRGDLYFRNLGGSAEIVRHVGRGVARLVTVARQTDVATSGGMQVQRFDLDVRDADGPVFRGRTYFGYFTREALAAQKGLPDATPAPPADVAIPLASHPALPRADLRMIDTVVHADPVGGEAGLGRYAAVRRVDPADWFFTAHFWLDPVMPGSLGLEALLQLARWVLAERCGTVGPYEALAGTRCEWTYRGQVRRENRAMQVDLEVREIGEGAIVCDGTVRADGLPIYRFEGFGVRRAEAAPASGPPARHRRPVAALLDAFEARGDEGAGRLRLDPRDHPWLDQHRPTLTAAAVPLAFAAEIAAEAALCLRPGRRVIGLPELRADRWIHVQDDPVDLAVVAVADGDTVAVSLGVGATVHMSAVVRVGEAWPAAPPAVPVDAPRIDWDGPAFFASGRTFHGPVLQAMVRLDRLGPAGALATLCTRPDADLLGQDGLPFVLDPLLLDAATHPMCSGEPERWLDGLPPGRLAYPVRAEGMTFHGPRPAGLVPCTLRLAEATRRTLAFDVRLGDWCTYRWVEALVPGGPALGQPPAIRRAFLWDREPVPEVTIGRPTARGWEVRAADLVEPLPGTLLALWGARDLRALAAKEAVRAWLRSRLTDGSLPGSRLRDVHPRDLVLADLASGGHAVGEAPSLTADEYVLHLHPTRIALESEGDGTRAEAWIRPRE